MEPVFMILGQSAATAACLSIDKEIAVQELTYEELQPVLVKDGQVLEYDGPRKSSAVHKAGVDPKTLKGVVVDDEQATKVGSWGTSSSVGGFIGNGYLHDADQDKGQSTVRFEAKLPEAGLYELRMSYTPNPNRASNVPVEVKHAAGVSTIKVNQKQPTDDDGFKTLGKFSFGETAVITISNTETNGHVIADAIQLLPVKPTR